MHEALRFLKRNRGGALAISLLLLVPCFWHRRIEAGDLASHVYNAWLAQLIEHGQAPGLYLARQWNNVLVDVALLRLGSLLGFVAAERIVASACVLIFFWGAFAFITTVSGREPWTLTPGLAMISFGWTFYMGFLNFYLALGLAMLTLPLILRPRRKSDQIVALLLSGLVWLAHPLGLVCLIGLAGYFWLASRLGGGYRWGLWVAGFGAVFAARELLLRRQPVFWDTPFFYKVNGSDQLVLFGARYEVLANVVFAFGCVIFLSGLVREWREVKCRATFRAPLELWSVLLFAAAMVPEAFSLPQYAGVVAFLISRVTTISAVLGLCVLGSVRPRRWHFIGLALAAGAFFTWMYQDTGTLNRMEAQAEKLVSSLPYGRRVTESIFAPEDSRISFINHVVDRACIGRCFTYANYEPSSGQFRVRVRQGSPIVSSNPDETEAMESGEYLVQPNDLPMSHIYQCDEHDLTRLCIRDLSANEKNGRIGYHPPP